jgi:hypothetical protein
MGPAARLLLLLALGGTLAAGRSAAATNRPEPPPPPKQQYDPDRRTCQSDHLVTTFRQQLQPWADQPERVQERLRALQADMLRSSLRRCVERGLLTPSQASDVERQLNLPVPSSLSTSPPASGSPSSGQRP